MNKRIIVQQLQSFHLAGVQEWNRWAAEKILGAEEEGEGGVVPAVESPVAEKKKKSPSVYQIPQPVQEIPMKKSAQPLPIVVPEEDLHALTLLEDREEALRQLGEKVGRCTRCLELVSNRTQTVLGVGNPYARLMFLGEAPGADEDRQGIPFVGRAGRLLTDMIEKGMKISRIQETYICNILRCRPPGNRAPLPTEAANCRHFLDTQIDIVKPEFICCLGASAAQFLLRSTTTISRMRGREYDYRGIRVVCTYHPAYLLRNPAQKVATWEDLQFLMRIMAETSAHSRN
ncbi:MAG: uracil-DNA glycosylase [Planctomycetia bacterium]|nr:uracil-DNA glycosylase [Planctomycetia bacterium]